MNSTCSAISFELTTPELNAAIGRICESRRERFADYIAKLAKQGAKLECERVDGIMASSVSLGRRHLANLLVAGNFARTRTEAFHRFLGPLANKVIAKLLLPIEEAIPLVRAAGGVTSLAHPSPELGEEDFRLLAELGLDGLETEYPWGRRSSAARLRDIAARLGLAITGGSDCHGPNPSHRRIGSRGISADELSALRRRCEQRAPCGLQTGFLVPGVGLFASHRVTVLHLQRPFREAIHSPDSSGLKLVHGELLPCLGHGRGQASVRSRRFTRTDPRR